MRAKHAHGVGAKDAPGRVIGWAFAVFNALGAGCLESVGENALSKFCAGTGSIVQQPAAKINIVACWSVDASWSGRSRICVRIRPVLAAARKPVGRRPHAAGHLGPGIGCNA
jgi:hypothetical protein